ncbi:hypothetical protein [Ruminococcus sp. NK3A76]|uniref:hypothetical protein n=1 Tax=Ruminococcus sp. NK3A76 TaxID=877411 RepID=UPI00048CB6EC|nr:hypothetical protein [Ruminococcus sp. NK3A76]
MIVSKLLSLSMALIMSASATTSSGFDMDYEGEINIYTGEPIVDEEDTEQQTVAIADGVTYDYEQNEYTYTLPNNNTISVRSNVPDKMITTKSVSLYYDSDILAKLYLDGEELDTTDMDLTEIEDVGSYALVISDADSEYQLLSFTIVPEKTGMISNYQMPDGFEIVEVAIDDEVQNISDKKIAKMKNDGDYLVSYKCKASKVEYVLKVTIDHTPPALEIDGVDDDGRAHGPVTVSGIEKNDSVTVTKDGEKFKLDKEGYIKMPGKYEISVTDDAGNNVTREFEIKFYLDRQGLLFGLLALAVIISIVVYMVRARKKLRVR